MQIPKPPKNYNSQSPIESPITSSEKQSTMIRIIIMIVVYSTIISVCYLVFSKNILNPFINKQQDLSNKINAPFKISTDTTKIVQAKTDEEINLPDRILFVSKDLVINPQIDDYSNNTLIDKTREEIIGLKINLKNIGKDDMRYDSFDFKIQDSTGDQKDPTYIGKTTDNLSIFDYGSLAVNSTKSGYIFFKVPINDPKLELIYNFYPPYPEPKIKVIIPLFETNSPTPISSTEKSLTEVPGEITWNDPQEITPTGLLSVFDTLYQPSVTISSQGEATAPPKYFKVGVWKSGEYKNGDVIDVQIPSIGEGPYNLMVQATTLNDSLIIFTKDTYLKGYNSEANSFAGSKFYDPKIKPDNRYLPELHIPDYAEGAREIYYPINGVDFHPSPTADFADLTGYKFLTTFYKGQKAYAKDQSTTTFPWDRLENVYTGLNLDQTAIGLSEKRDILDYNSKATLNWIKKPLDLKDGNKDILYSDYFSIGCTIKSINTFTENAQFNPQNLELVLTSSTENFYIPTNSDTILQSLFQAAKNSYYFHNFDNLSYDDFVKSFPILIWKNKLGYYQIIYRSAFNGGGCGKPVIYLYPTKKTNVSVRFGTEMKLTKTEPLYKNGWNVIAYPDGKLVNKIDLKTYPNLFWEGSSNLNLKQEEKGSVVKKENIKDFLDKTLSAYGLNNQEKQDFISFWLPRLQEKPYYKITFHTTNDLNTFVPLLISPQPDSMLRLLMEYHGLDKNELSIPQSPTTFIRKGFTVVEWGGIFGK